MCNWRGCQIISHSLSFLQTTKCPFQLGGLYDTVMIWYPYGNDSMILPCRVKKYFFLFVLRLLPAHFTRTSLRFFLKQWVNVSCSHNLWIIHDFIDPCLNHLFPIQRALINISHSYLWSHQLPFHLLFIVSYMVLVIRYITTVFGYHKVGKSLSCMWHNDVLQFVWWSCLLNAS